MFEHASTCLNMLVLVGTCFYKFEQNFTYFFLQGLQDVDNIDNLVQHFSPSVKPRIAFFETFHQQNAAAPGPVGSKTSIHSQQSKQMPVAGVPSYSKPGATESQPNSAVFENIQSENVSTRVGKVGSKTSMHSKQIPLSEEAPHAEIVGDVGTIVQPGHIPVAGLPSNYRNPGQPSTAFLETSHKQNAGGAGLVRSKTNMYSHQLKQMPVAGVPSYSINVGQKGSQQGHLKFQQQQQQQQQQQLEQQAAVSDNLEQQKRLYTSIPCEGSGTCPNCMVPLYIFPNFDRPMGNTQ